MIDVVIREPSNWSFSTFGGGSVGAAIGVAGGQVVLVSPQQRAVTFTYGGIGGGASVGLRLPRLPKLRFTATGAPLAFPSTGVVFETTNCPGPDLVEDDFRGPCMFVDGGLGLVGGASGTIMIAGCWPTWRSQLQSLLSPLAVIPGVALLRQILMSARAVIPMAGVNVGIQAGAGVAGYLGAMF